MTTYKAEQFVATLLTTALLTACGSTSSGPTDLDGIPEQSAFQLALTEDANAEGLATESDWVDPAVEDVVSTMTGAETLEVAPGLTKLRQEIKEFNQALRAFLQPIAALVRETEPSARDGNMAVWGPVTRGATEYRFILRKGALHRFGWLLQAREAEVNAEFVGVAAGRISVGFRARRGAGSFGLDLDTLGAIEPTLAQRGKVLAGFAHGPEGTALAYRLNGFSRDLERREPFDALFQGVHLSRGANRLRLAFHGNLPNSATEAEELILARGRHIRGEGGRVDVIATGGDIQADRAWVVSECWNTELGVVFRRVLECPLDGPGGDQCELVSTTGDVMACARDLRTAELPPLDPGTVMEDAESPYTVEPPTSMPDGEPPAEE